MLYCDACAKTCGWVISPFSRSFGPCEVCKTKAPCNNVSAKNVADRFLSTALAEGGQSISPRPETWRKSDG